MPRPLFVNLRPRPKHARLHTEINAIQMRLRQSSQTLSRFRDQMKSLRMPRFWKYHLPSLSLVGARTDTVEVCYEGDRLYTCFFVLQFTSLILGIIVM